LGSAVESYHDNARFLRSESENETVGVELILLTLLDKARELGLDLPYDVCSSYCTIREEKRGESRDKTVLSHAAQYLHDN
jgi:hypothetical protein